MNRIGTYKDGYSNAQITLTNPMSGRYDVYVGTFRGIDPIPVTLKVTELR